MTAVELDDKIIPEITFSELNDTENLDVFEACMKNVLQSKIQWTKFDNASDLLSVLKLLLIHFEVQAKQLIFREQHSQQEVIEAMIRTSKV